MRLGRRGPLSSVRFLNSETVNELVAAHSVRGGKGFGTPSMLDFIPLRHFDPSNSQHLELAVQSRRAHADAAREYTL